MRPLTCSSEASNCTMGCGENFGDAEPVQYFWKNGEAGKWESGVKRKVIYNDEETRSFKSFTCKVKNLFSEKESDPLENPFSKSGGSNTGVVVGVVVAIILIVLAVAGYFIYQKFINNRARFCPGSADHNGRPVQPVVEGKPAETTEMLGKGEQEPTS
ncbi:hypothetical protein XENORESO_006234 [Xenotaenia resolanae]|uniref:Ig-like domain-containing protein n=1 Tax=Xenotaenia resolanae TaxID=208358 RepID=A0ABV0WL22_9TELE